MKKTVKFLKAKPIWAKGREYERNLTLSFEVRFPKTVGTTSLRITASSVYRFFINGVFSGYGPARGPHGYYRVDEWNVHDKLQNEENIILIEVAGYNVNSFYLLDQPSFLQAEILCNMIVIAHTSASGTDFNTKIVEERIQKVQRYSFQRTFVEAYRMVKMNNNKYNPEQVTTNNICCVEMQEKKLLPRGVSYPEFKKRHPMEYTNKGSVSCGHRREEYWKNGSLVNIGDTLKGYKEEELEIHLSDELQEMDFIFEKDKPSLLFENSIGLDKNTFGIYDFGLNLTGFIGLKIHCTGDTRVIVTFDEILSNGDVDFKRMDCVNAVCFYLSEGVYELETFGPYTLRYMKVIAFENSCKIENVYLREYVNPDVQINELKSSNEKLNIIFNAAVQTFKQNAVDKYMDCPSRERAGWLCDSFFTARVEYLLTGKSLIEKNFLENFLLPDRFDCLPRGMLPMCYPADHYDGVFIPNWSLWFILELEEYLDRSGDTMLVSALKTKVYLIFEYFERFINEYGLLEKLEGWIFVEWSKANELIRDVNFPTNMLYAGALSACGRMYSDSALLRKADGVRETIRKLSFDGRFFSDNAVRHGNRLESTGSATEVCQYYAFYFDIASPITYPKLWDTLVYDFGPQRKKNGTYPEVYPANSFIGNYLRLDILSKHGFEKKVTKEIEKYFYYMAERTGTLWENDSDFASCNHGFASYVACWLLKNTTEK